MHEAHRQRLAGRRGKIEIDDGVAGRARIGLHRTDERHAVAGDDFGQRRGARREAREIDAQPFGERRVDVGDAALLVGGEESGRRVVEMVDRLLQVEEEALLLGALPGDVVELPGKQRLPLPRRVECPRADPVPARARLGARADGLREPELAVAGDPVPQAGSKSVDRRRRLRHVGQQVLDRLDVGRRRSPGHFAIALVGVNDPPLGVGDQKPCDMESTKALDSSSVVERGAICTKPMAVAKR